MKTMNSTPPFHRTRALSTAWRMSRDMPTIVSDTTTVISEAAVSVTLRRRLLAVSRSA